MARILGISEKFPTFSVQACVSIEPGEEFKTISNADLKGKWSVIFFWPMDFTFVCPTEIAAFDHESKAFEQRNAQVYGASTDTHFVHLAWRLNHPELKNLKFPMLADQTKDLSEQLGILHPVDKIAYRATFIVDPEGTIRWVTVNDMSVGRNVKEVLRTLDALQTDALVPCNWEKGQATL